MACFGHFKPSTAAHRWHNSSATCGSGRRAPMHRIRVSARRREPSANTTASSCATSTYCAVALSPPHGRICVLPTGISFRPRPAGSSRDSASRATCDREMVWLAVSFCSFVLALSWRKLIPSAFGVLLAATGPVAFAFGFEDVAARARQLANASFKEPEFKLPKELQELDYDRFRDIRFKPERSVWRDAKLQFELAFFHLGQ